MCMLTFVLMYSVACSAYADQNFEFWCQCCIDLAPTKVHCYHLVPGKSALHCVSQCTAWRSWHSCHALDSHCVKSILNHGIPAMPWQTVYCKCIIVCLFGLILRSQHDRQTKRSLHKPAKALQHLSIWQHPMITNRNRPGCYADVYLDRSHESIRLCASVSTKPKSSLEIRKSGRWSCSVAKTFMSTAAFLLAASCCAPGHLATVSHRPGSTGIDCHPSSTFATVPKICCFGSLMQTLMKPFALMERMYFLWRWPLRSS